MDKLILKKTNHNIKIGDVCETIQPNVTKDCLFIENQEVIGFYIRDISNYSKKIKNIAEIANAEFLSERVPKSTMRRSNGVEQYSTIIGSVAARPHMRRPYNTMSSVHNKQSAKTFLKAMLMLAKESENIIKELAPNIYAKQKRIFDESVPDNWKLGNLFTSSISNYNIAASYHKDSGNIQECVNVIITKRKDSTGGNTTVPDYNATVDSCDNSMLVYPAWRNVHGVTPITPTKQGGYRNSLVFYPLKAFLKKNE